MIKFYCDFCGHEVEHPESQLEFRTEVHPKNAEDSTNSRILGIKVMRSMDGAWNGGHICIRCLSQGLKQIIRQLKED